MNKKAKIMLVLLSAATMTAGVLGLAGCKKSGNTTATPSVEQTYQSYVAYAQANNLEVLSYDEWIQAILGASKPGPAGPQGEDGEKGEQGNPGEPGATIDKIVLSPDGKELIISYTDGRTEDRIKLPEQVTHVHTYGGDDDIVVLIPKGDKDGLGYKVCQDKGCDHVELVVLKKSFDVTVKMDGNPVEGIDVVINGQRATSNSKGVASVVDFGDFNDYIISVDTQGYATDRVYRTGNASTMEIGICKVLDSTVDEYGNKVGLVNRADTFSMIIGTADDGWGGIEISENTVYVRGGETQAKKYRITPSSDAAEIKDANYNNVLVDGSYTVTVPAGGSVEIKFTANMMKLLANNHPAGDDFIYKIEVEELPSPVEGSEDLPLLSPSNEAVTLPEGATDWVYYTWNNPDRSIGEISFELTGVDVEFSFKEYDTKSWKVKDKALEAVAGGQSYKLVEGSNNLNATKPYSFRVKAHSGATEASFKINALTPLGTLLNPQVAKLGERNAYDYGSNQTDTAKKWFKFDVQQGEYIVALEGYEYSIYKGKPQSENERGLYYSQESKSLVKLDAGEYYIAVNSQMIDNNRVCAFTLRNYNAAEDEGTILSKPKAITVDLSSGNATFETTSVVAGTTMYYTFNAPNNGTLKVSASVADGNLSDYNVFLSNANGSMTTRTEVTYKKDNKIIVSAVSYAEGVTSFTVKLEWTEEKPVDPVDPPVDPENPDNPEPPKPVAKAHVFTVTDSKGAAVAGVKVSVVIDAETKVEGTTDENGNVTLSFIPGAYKVNLSGYDADEYLYEGFTTKANSQTCAVKLRNDKVTYAFTVKVKEGANLFGATVKIMNGETVVAESTDTDNDGIVNVSVFLPSAGSYKAEIILAEADADKYTLGPNDIYELHGGNKNDPQFTVEFVAATEYVINVSGAYGVNLEGITATVTYGKKVVGEATANADGIIKLKVYGATANVISFSNLPEGYLLASFNGAATSESYTVKLIKADNASTGTANKMMVEYDNTGETSKIIVGDNAITNTAAYNYYQFKAPTSGTYSFRIEDPANKGYIKSLQVGANWDAVSLIVDGREVKIDYNLVLGKNRAYNKAYEFTLTLGSGARVIVGYETDTGAKGDAHWIVEKLVETPDPVSLAEGENTVTLTYGSASCVYNYLEETVLAFSWTDESVSVTVNGAAYVSGTELTFYGDEQLEITVSSSTSTSVVIVATVTELEGPGDRN